MTRALVCGGRDFDDRDALYAALDRLHAEHHFSILIAGGARGADTLAYEWAKARGVPTEVYMAEWERLGARPARSATSAWSMTAGRISSSRSLEEKARPEWWRSRSELV